MKPICNIIKLISIISKISQHIGRVLFPKNMSLYCHIYPSSTHCNVIVRVYQVQLDRATSRLISIIRKNHPHAQSSHVQKRATWKKIEILHKGEQIERLNERRSHNNSNNLYNFIVTQALNWSAYINHLFPIFYYVITDRQYSTCSKK